jgi:tetratricopeptide (TPR) repeat protein
MIFGPEDIEIRLRASFEHGDPRASAAAAIAWAAVKRNRGEPAAALELLREAVRVGERESGARAWFELADFLAENGEESGARRAFARAAELSDPRSTPDVAIDLAGRAEANENRAGAAEIYREVLGARPGAALATLAALRLAAIHRAAGDPGRALSVLQEVPRTGEEGELAVEAELALAELLLELRHKEAGRAECAERLLASVIEVDHPDHSPRAALLLARRLGARRNFSRAFELLVAVTGCGSPDVVAEADAELSAQIARQSEPEPMHCVPLAWSGESCVAGEETAAAGTRVPELEAISPAPALPAAVVPLFGPIEAADDLAPGRVVVLRHLLPRPGISKIERDPRMHHAPRPAAEITCGPALLEAARISYGVAGPPAGLLAAERRLTCRPSPLGGLLRRLAGFLRPAAPTYELGSYMASHHVALHHHHDFWSPGAPAMLTSLLGSLRAADHSEEALREMLLAWAAECARPTAAETGLPRIPLTTWAVAGNPRPEDAAVSIGSSCRAEPSCSASGPGHDRNGYRAFSDVFSEHRERVAVALADGLIISSPSEVRVTVSTFTEQAMQFELCGQGGGGAGSARDDLADLAVALDQDPPAFLTGVLEPALERDGVA